MDTLDKVIKAAEKLQPFTFNIVGSGAAFTPLAILWAGYTVAEAIKEAAGPLEHQTDQPPKTITFRVSKDSGSDVAKELNELLNQYQQGKPQSHA